MQSRPKLYHWRWGKKAEVQQWAWVGEELALTQSLWLQLQATSTHISLRLLAAVKEVSPKLKSHVLNVFMFCVSFSEPQKYQQMLEPPAIAKPFTIDVDKKLEEGQKVCNLSVIKGNLCERVFFFFWLFCFVLYLCPLRMAISFRKPAFVFTLHLFICVWWYGRPHGFHVASWDLTFNSECQELSEWWGTSTLTS